MPMQIICLPRGASDQKNCFWNMANKCKTCLENHQQSDHFVQANLHTLGRLVMLIMVDNGVIMVDSAYDSVDACDEIIVEIAVVEGRLQVDVAWWWLIVELMASDN